MSNDNIIPVSTETSIRSEAASWIAQLDSDAFTDADRLALREWASRSPRHLAELKRLGAMWCDVDAALSEEAVRRLPGHASVAGFVAAAFEVRPTLFYRTAAALLVAVFCCVAVLFAPGPLGMRGPFAATYSVAEGAQQLFTLPDGSQVHLNTDSMVQVELTGARRTVRLIRGEAHFDVAEDAKRPFEVHANGHVVTAVGTAFVVRVNRRDTMVLVTEGRVALTSLSVMESPGEPGASRSDGAVTPTLLIAGQAASVNESEPNAPPEVSPVSTDMIVRQLAWREGFLLFDGESLVEVIEEVSRYTPSQIVISDPTIRQIPIGGSFKAGEVDDLLGALEMSFGVSARRVGDDLIYLSRESSG